MKAIVYEKYGLPEVLQLTEVEKPTPKKNEVLIKVHAASVNSWDWDLLRGKPIAFRFWGLFKPKYTIPGADVAGIIEDIGEDVTNFNIGDEVFGDLCESGWGSFAQYVCANENSLSIKSTKMTFEQAAALPQGGVMAYQSLFEKINVKGGDKVLMNGAAGAVGSVFIQIAKTLHAEVTAVDEASKFDFLRSLGADYVIDYKKEDFVESDKKYDLIIDVVTNRSVWKYKRILSDSGVYLTIGGKVGPIFQAMFLGPILSMFSSKRLGILAQKPNKYLNELTKLFEEGKLIPVIDKTYDLNEVPKALQYIGDGKVKGKLIIKII
jgi:NADPH:quinone reductase-like Zn-dependent oxidoreductase